MATTRKANVLECLIREILAGEKHGAPTPYDQADTHLSALVRLDYGEALRRHFDRAQMRRIIADLRRSLPKLNCRVFANTDLRCLARVAERLGARLVPNTFTGREGRELRGFYADTGMFRRQPLICVNTANHPVAVAAAFWHEVGHHLGRQLLDQRRVYALSFTTGYPDHLNSICETVADIVMVLGGYPQSAARRLFGGGESGTLDDDLLIEPARGHLRSISFEFLRTFSSHENLCYLGGMIHVAKLRAALLREFHI